MKKMTLMGTRICLIFFIISMITVCQSSVDHAEASSTSDTIVWMTDTQYYAKEYPEIFFKMTDWIKENQVPHQIKYAVHTGDIIDQYQEKDQWKTAHKALKKLDHSPIPYGVLAGNHDVGHSRVDYEKYSHYFGDKRFKHQKEFAGSDQNNRNHFDLVTVGDRDLLMLYLGWGMTDKDLEWAHSVLNNYPDRIVFLNVHEYLKADGTRSEQGELLFKGLVAKHASIHVVLCGHYHGANKKVDRFDDDGDGKPDRTVYQLLADYQSGPMGGQGYLRLLSIPSNSTEVTVKTYSPFLDQYNFYKDTELEKDQFTIHLPLSVK